MKHKIKGRKLNRDSSHRKALLMNLSNSLIKHELIKTTVAKAKELRPFIEKIITVGKKGGLHNIRIASSILNDKETVSKLFKDLAPRFKDRSGGYVRVIRNGFRLGDKAPMAVIEFVDRVAQNDNEEDKKGSKVKKIAKKSDKQEDKAVKTESKKPEVKKEEKKEIQASKVEEKQEIAKDKKD
jgi:large subunit ribosomal protein L17